MILHDQMFYTEVEFRAPPHPPPHSGSEST